MMVLKMINEEWREVVGWEGFYEVSNLGRVRSISRTITRGDGSVQTWRSRAMRTSANGAGYLVVRLSNSVAGRRLMARVHRLVAEAFIPNPCHLPEVNHKDGNKANACVTNLEWTTPHGNRKHAWDTGLRTRDHLPVHYGTEKPNAKLDDAAVRHIRTIYLSAGKPLAALARLYGVDKKTVMDVVREKTWRHLLPPPPESTP